MRCAAAIQHDDDLDKLETVTVECYRCDPDNPLAVPRPACPNCRGTGRSPSEFVPILREIREARTGPRITTSRDGASDDLYLEY